MDTLDNLSTLVDKPFVHIATDEKFIDTAFNIYEKAFPSANIFIILTKSPNNKPRFLSSKLPYIFINTSTKYFIQIESFLSLAKYIVYHSFTNEMVDIFFQYKNSKAKNIWTLFGYELHNHPYVAQRRLYGEITYKKYIRSPIKDFKNFIRPYYNIFFRFRIDLHNRKLRALSQMDYVAVLYREEFEHFKKGGYLENALYVKFTYAPIGILIEPDLGFVLDDNILFGNSSSYTNNHIEGLNLLHNLEIDHRQIIVPLSYGKVDYANDIIQFGTKLFETQFKPLTEFLPQAEYYKLISKCGIVVMNHYRQQALGNVLYSLYIGAKVYLSHQNTLYHYLKRIGCQVFCIEEELVPENKSVFELLTQNQMEENRRILYEELNIDRICRELQNNLPL